jgi:outer membrane protein assembly factor BamB
MWTQWWVLAALQPLAAQAPVPAAPTASPLPLRVLWKLPLGSLSFGGGAVADANGDGVLDIAFSTYFGEGKVRVVSGRDGAPIWSYDASIHPGTGDSCLDASCRFVDLTGDGTLELVVPVSNTSQVLAFDAATGGKRWTYEAGKAECIDTPPWIGSIDGKPSIVVGTFQGRLHVVDATNGARLRTVRVVDKGAVQSCAAVLDLNGDGHEDYVATSFNGDGRVVAVDGVRKSTSAAGGTDAGAATSAPPSPPGAEVYDELNSQLWHVQTTSKMLYHGPSVGDLDADGKADLVIGSYDGKVYAVRADGTALWTTPKVERYIMGPTALGDIDGDGAIDVLVAGDKVTALRGKDGSVMWSTPFTKKAVGSWSVTRGVSIADLDGDGGLDVAALDGRGVFKAFRGKDGTLIHEFNAGELCDRAVTMNSHVPLIADFDADGKVDVFFVVGAANPEKQGDSAGVAVCLTGFTGPARREGGELNGWFMHRHDPHNTGNVATPLPEALTESLLKALGAAR